MNSRTASLPVLPATNTTSSSTTAMTSTQASIKVTLQVPLMKPEQLYPTPSMKDFVPYDVEFDLRLTGCELIQTSGRLLKLPQTAMATGQVLFHRFYYSKSFVKNPMEYYAMAAIFLSTKIEECPRRIRDVLNVFHHIKLVRTGKIIKPMPIDENYHKAKNEIIKAERRLLKELGFCVHVKHPHKIIFIYLQAMECNQENLKQKAWNYMNDSLRTDIFLRYTPEMIASACIFLSARELEISLPENPPWYTIFGADEQSIKAICVRILHLYTHKTRSQEELEKIINECREKLEIEKKKSKEPAISSEIKTDLKSVDSEQTIVATSAEIKKTSEQIKQISAGISAKAKSFAHTPPGMLDPSMAPIHPNPYYINHNHHHHSHHMTRHSSFNYYQGAPPGPYDYYGAYNEHGYYNENYYEMTNLKRNKSASYLPAHPKDYDDYHKRDKVKSYKDEYSRHRSPSRSRSRSRSRSHSRKLQDKKNRSSKHKSRSRSRSRTIDSIETDRSPSSSKHKKKKSHHSRHKEDSHEKTRRERSSRDRERGKEKEKEKEHRHHKSSKHSKERASGNDPRYVPIYS